MSIIVFWLINIFLYVGVIVSTILKNENFVFFFLGAISVWWILIVLSFFINTKG